MGRMPASYSNAMDVSSSRRMTLGSPASHEGNLRGRLAPSPTGYLHLGNARSFLLAWLDMRSRGGEILLRIEDIDIARAVGNADQEIVRDLRWIGLDWDNDLTEGFHQSRRRDIYRNAIEDLHARGYLYECFCSRRELRYIASAPHVRDPVYPGTCRTRGAGERHDLRRVKSPSLRVRVPDAGAITFVDRVRGEVSEHLMIETGDFIIARADGVISYQLAVVVDDIQMGISDVVRGEDLLSSTARQIFLFQTFGAPPPRYAHVPLMYGPDGHRLSKRHGHVSLAELRTEGRRPQEIVGELAYSCGLIDRPEPCAPSDLVAHFAIERIGSQR